MIVQSSNIISFSRDKCVYLKLRRFLIIIWVANFSSQTTWTQLFAEDFLWLPIFCDDYVTTENLCDDWTFLINISFPQKISCVIDTGCKNSTLKWEFLMIWNEYQKYRSKSIISEKYQKTSLKVLNIRNAKICIRMKLLLSTKMINKGNLRILNSASKISKII